MLSRDYQHMLHQPSSGEIIFNWDYFHINNLPSYWQFIIPLCKWISSLSITLSFCQWGNVGHERVGNLPRFVQPVARTRPSDPKQGHFHNTTLQLLPAFTGSWACKNYHKKLSQDIRAFRIGPAGTQSPQDLYTDTPVFSMDTSIFTSSVHFLCFVSPNGIHWQQRTGERGFHRSRKAAYVFSCCRTNRHKLSTSKQHRSIISQFPCVRSPSSTLEIQLRNIWVGWVLWSRSQQAEIKVSATTAVSSEAQSLLPNSLIVGRIHFLMALFDVPIFLLLSRSYYQLLETASSSLPHGPPGQCATWLFGFFQSSSSSSLWLLPSLTF